MSNNKFKLGLDVIMFNCFYFTKTAVEKTS